MPLATRLTDPPHCPWCGQRMFIISNNQERWYLPAYYNKSIPSHTIFTFYCNKCHSISPCANSPEDAIGLACAGHILTDQDLAEHPVIIDEEWDSLDRV